MVYPHEGFSLNSKNNISSSGFPSNASYLERKEKKEGGRERERLWTSLVSANQSKYIQGDPKVAQNL